MDNPIDGILPDFQIFGVEFTELWEKVFAGVWGLFIVITIVVLLVNIGKIASASTSKNPNELAAARTSVLWSTIALAAALSIGVIVGAIISLTS